LAMEAAQSMLEISDSETAALLSNVVNHHTMVSWWLIRMDALYFTVTVLFVSVLVAALLFRAAHHHTHGILQRMPASRLVKLVADDIFIAAGTIAPAW